MSLQIGQQLGSYQITSLIGKGGMGEVYRAKDTKLKRDVAIKILPDEFSRDTDRVARFQREAESLAALNHQNIAAIYDLQQGGTTRFLILEFVDGDTLADILKKRGALPIDEALNIAKQICEALEAAHEKGVIHRDLKPANVKITPEGKVKVLDFGLAKAFETETSKANLSQSPTLSIAATNAGVILGTAAYMSPEQARGKNVDRRSDIWAFGCVLYEMLAGEQAFKEDDVTDILAAVIRAEPDLQKLPANTPRAIRQLIRRCLEKDRHERLPDIAMARIEIRDSLSAPLDADAIPSTKSSKGLRIAWSAAGLLTLALVTIVTVWPPWRASTPAIPLRLSTELGADISLTTNVIGNATLALSPDGNVLAFVGTQNGVNQIYVRRLGQLTATPLSGTNGALSPFFSPDGEWLGFFADGKLKKISVTGGGAVTLGDASLSRGGAWGDDGTIIFSSAGLNANVALQLVSAAGGQPQPVTEIAQGESGGRWPQVLPGAKAVLYAAPAIGRNLDDANLVVQPLPAGVAKIVVRGGYYGRYVASGHIVYINQGRLIAIPFDLDRLEVTGQPVPIIEDVTATPANGAAHFAVSNSGTLAYLPGQSFSIFESPILWMTSDGKTLPLRSTPTRWSNPRFAPDGRTIAVDITDGYVAVYDPTRDALTRLTFGTGPDRKPVWTPDGRRIVFESFRGNVSRMNWLRSDGTGEIQQLTESSHLQYPSSWHPDGKHLAFNETNPQTQDDLMILSMEGDDNSGWKPGIPNVFLNTPAAEQEPMFSSDGRWIAYQSNESGRFEIFVRPFPGPGGKSQVSTAGGTLPTWSRTRREILYKTPDNRIMVASYVVEGGLFKAAKPRLWSEQPISPRQRQRWFDLHPDGNRLAVSVPAGAAAEDKRDKVVFILNFFDELRRIAPPSKK